jgi:hypothetical protein
MCSVTRYTRYTRVTLHICYTRYTCVTLHICYTRYTCVTLHMYYILLHILSLMVVMEKCIYSTWIILFNSSNNSKQINVSINIDDNNTNQSNTSKNIVEEMYKHTQHSYNNIYYLLAVCERLFRMRRVSTSVSTASSLGGVESSWSAEEDVDEDDGVVVDSELVVTDIGVVLSLFHWKNN